MGGEMERPPKNATLDVDAALASYELPSSPCRSPTGAENMSVWVEMSGGEQTVHMALTDTTDMAPPPLPTSPTTEPVEFPLVLCDDTDMNGVHAPCSALVPFQKLQMDTNLHQTLLPARPRPVKFASALHAAEADTITSDFMHALRLGEFHQEPQLSVRLRGSRVELASSSDDEHVDYLGPAENIKKLFKLPYSQARVSLAVHRVGSTLVVDGDLDDHDIAMGFEDLPQETMKLQPQTDEMTQNLLYEKFIYQSILNGGMAIDNEHEEQGAPTPPAPEQLPVQLAPSTKGSKKTKKAKKLAKKRALERAESQAQSPVLLPRAKHPRGSSLDLTDVPGPDRPTNERKQHKPSAFHQGNNPSDDSAPRPFRSTPYDSPYFQRILKWKFHDLKMILGSEMLLFSNKEHPAVSLRLHDMDKELSLCTVLDYYLDNVIANIPELAICMHSKGFVRGYKLVETSQIPHISENGRPLFDVHEVSMNAGMLLKFLQENCSRPNGTYWLYRKEGENSLRLYDVNVLSQGKQLKWKYMMAMLCYRFASRASRLIHSVERNAPRLQNQLQQRQRDLLRTCMSLLEEITQAGGAAHSSICSSVTEQLADTYLQEYGRLQMSENRGNEAESDDHAATIVESLMEAKKYLRDSIRAFEQCVQRDEDEENSFDDVNDEEVDGDDEGEMASFMDEELRRLQMKYCSACVQLAHAFLHQKGHLHDAMSTIVEACQFLRHSDMPVNIVPLSDPHNGSQQIDQLLGKIDFDGIRQSSHRSERSCSTATELCGCLLELVGDMASSCPKAQYQQLNALYSVVSGEDSHELARLLEKQLKWLDAQEPTLSSTDVDPVEALLLLSFRSYIRSLSLRLDSELYFAIMKKLGNASNELGKYYLSQKQCYQEAFVWFQRGCRVFAEIEDAINVALLNANMAHLHKLLAQNVDGEAKESHYRSAVELCVSAVHQLKTNKAETELHQKVKGELALTYLVWAVYKTNVVFRSDAKTSDDDKKKTENDSLKLFNKALALYSELGDDKQVASTHYQMASFYTKTIASVLKAEGSKRDDVDAARASHLRGRMEIARRHYDKALDYFGKMEVGKIFILIHQELADLYSFGGRIEDIEHAVLFLLNTLNAFKQEHGSQSNSEVEAMQALAQDVTLKLQQLLHQLVRLIAMQPQLAKSKKMETYKRMYKEVIYQGKDGGIVAVLTSLRAAYLL
ncbi:TPA: hypothetical protein N0F65_006491 [Lagenidium giganteum]|uniref:Erythroid differentiation-related factor 1 n=1 Tax=Lagenidium giganteum TaxID=4803 RepID=A0AAV2YR12_9STRA|nr:TPA: hypothetical protein N0F65_006491 [Lagenidium giganteum]